jgi:hypothetical protein
MLLKGIVYRERPDRIFLHCEDAFTKVRLPKELRIRRQCERLYVKVTMVIKNVVIL